jgi:hypothetical protein
MPAMPPIENNTSAGTPLATQNAPRQSMDRTSSFGTCPPEMFATSTVMISLPGKFCSAACDAVSLLFQPNMKKCDQT